MFRATVSCSSVGVLLWPHPLPLSRLISRLFQPVVGGMHRSRPLAGSSAHAPFPAVGGINNVAAIQPAVGGGAVVAAPAVGGLAPAIGAGGGGGCHPGSSGDGTAVDNPVHRHANRTVQCPMFLAEEFGRCT